MNGWLAVRLLIQLSSEGVWDDSFVAGDRKVLRELEQLGYVKVTTKILKYGNRAMWNITDVGLNKLNRGDL